ncbi:MAG: hypothetical protein K2N56_04560 [Oscillospiraceae bacterium]|nr:hypothetical protein [Oscillospiraceae bacterium]
MLTKDIEDKLRKSENFDESMIENNAPQELHVLINQYIDEKQISKPDFIRMLNIYRNYGYQILNGTRLPTRNCLIQMALILELSSKQLDVLLRLAEKAPLYVRNVVDARVFYALEHHIEYYKALDFIWGDGEIV